MNKSFVTNLISIVLIGSSLLVDESIASYLLMTGLFALSGAITNVLAVHMLFEKVPLLYGSGVITARFEDFKLAIKNLMMDQFFTKEQLDNFFANEEKKISLAPIIETTDFTPAFDALTKTVMESAFGGMLGMFGGEKALNSLKEPFTSKLKSAVLVIVESEEFNTNINSSLQSSSLSEDMLKKIENVIDMRLEELSAQMVKEMLQKLIKEHLGWLVVWGGVFGGVIGLLSSFIL